MDLKVLGKFGISRLVMALILSIHRVIVPLEMPLVKGTVLAGGGDRT